VSSVRSKSAVVLELAEEFLDRYRRGERPALKEYIAQHPDLAAEIRELFPAMAMMENIALTDEALAEDEGANGKRPPPAVPEQFGDYRILREVGRGGMGIVYEAEQVSLGRHVALKVLKTLLDPKQKRRFQHEARAAAKLHHTNIVPVFGVGEDDDGTPYYVMQFIQGLGLDEVLRELKRMQGAGVPSAGEVPVARQDVSAAVMAHSLLTGEFLSALISTLDVTPVAAEPSASAVAGPTASRQLSGSLPLSSGSVVLPGQSRDGWESRGRKQTYWQSVARIGVQVAEALEHAHGQGVLHRDIKPSNLLLDLRGTVWVADFGLAKADDQQNLTHSGDILGTPRYMPPEAFEGMTDRRGDIYSLGLTLYELLALRPAFQEHDRHRLMKLVTTTEPQRLDRINRSVPRDLVTIVHKAIDRNVAHRYQSAGELAADLQRFLDDEPIRARPVRPWERVAKWAKRRPAAAALVALSVAVVVALFAGVLAVNAMLRARTEVAEAAVKERERADRRLKLSDLRPATDSAIGKKDWDEAIRLLQIALEIAAAKPPLEEELAKLKEFMDRVKKDQHNDNPKLREKARQTYKQFRHLHEEALFRATFPLSRDRLDRLAEMRAAQQAAEAALGLFGWKQGQEWDLDLEEPYQDFVEAIRSDCYELFLLLADAVAQPDGNPGLVGQGPNLSEAIAILDQAGKLRTPTRGYYLRRMRYQLQNGQRDTAAEAQKQAEKARLEAFDFLLDGYSLLRKGELDKSIWSFNEALKERPNYFWAHYLLALCHLRAGRTGSALECLNDCLRAESQPPPLVYLVRGVVHAKLGEFDKAEDDFRKGLNTKPDRWIAYGLYNNRGVTRLRRHDLMGAVEDFQSAIGIEPDHLEAHLNLSEAFEELARIAGTPRPEIALLAPPSVPVVRPVLACALLDRVYWLRKAGEQLEKAGVFSNKDASLLVRRARLHRECGELEVALKVISQAVDLAALGTESRSAIYAERGRIRSQLGEKHKEYEAALMDFEAALKDFESALADPKSNALIHYWKAGTLEQMAKVEPDPARRAEHYREAEAALDPYLKSRTVYTWEVRAVFRFRGLLRIKLNKYSGAISDLTMALEARADPELLVLRGQVHLELKEFNDALDDFDTALSLNPKNGHAHNGRGLALLLKPNPTSLEVSDAVRHAEKALACGPRTEFLLYGAACVYAQAARVAADGYRGGRESSETAVRLLEEISLAEVPTALRDMIMKDPLLAPIRDSSDFDRIKRRLFRERH
jgi:serine/threonine protein kinase/tetratricopeptide (TPR) repeat protein